MRRLPAAAAVSLLAALPMLAPAADAAPRNSRGTVYGGATSQDNPIILTVAAHGKWLNTASMFVDTRCADGDRLALPITVAFARGGPALIQPGQDVLRGGRLSRRGTFRSEGSGAVHLGSATGSFRQRLTGTVGRDGGAAGKLRMTVHVTDVATGTPLTRCDSSVVRWSARSERGRVFGGHTTEGLPVVVELDEGGQALRHFRFAWHADCIPVGGITFGDRISFRRMAGGAYSEVFQHTTSAPDGSRQLQDYAVNVRTSRSTVSGDFSVKLTEFDPAGATVTTCDTRTQAWTARSG